MNPLLSLLSIALGHRDRMERALSEEEWFVLLKTALDQSLLGVLSPALEMLPADQKVPRRPYVRWLYLSEKVKGYNADMIEKGRSLSADLAADGVASCLLKGQGVARYYPCPELRQCGDIDVWVRGETPATIAYFRSRCGCRDIVYHHMDVEWFDKISVEVHFKPSWMNSFVMDRKLQRFFDELAPEQFSHVVPELGYACPTVRFDAVFGLVHIFRHFFYEGVGLRQLMDYYYILESLPENERDWVRCHLSDLGLDRFSSAVSWVLGEVFHQDSARFLFAPCEKTGRLLLDEVMLAGNFGKRDSRYAALNDRNIFVRAFAKTCRLASFLRFYPREVLAAPLFKTWQFVWRKRNHYL